MVITDVNQVVYQGNGSNTAFPFTFRIIDATDIQLLLIDEDGTETDITSDYFVDINTNTVHYPGYAPGSAPAEADQPAPVQTGQKLMIYRKLPITQEKDLGDKWPFYVIELALDKLTMILQDIWDWCGRCLQVSRGQAAAAGDDFDPTVPLEADKVIAGNANGTGFDAREAMMEVNGAWDGEGRQIHDVADPTAVGDAATKKYVDENINYVDNTFMKLQADGKAWESRGLPVSNIATPGKVKDATTKEYVDNLIDKLSVEADRYVVFNTVAAMVAADLPAGYNTRTLGYYDINDGGAGTYSIRGKVAGETEDGGSVIFLNNGNVAELITDGTVTPEQFGAYGDNTHDDSTAVQNAVNFASVVQFLNKEYKFNSAITLKTGVCVCGMNVTDTAISNMLHFADDGFIIDGNYVKIKNLRIAGTGTGSGIKADKMQGGMPLISKVSIEGVRINNFAVGVDLSLYMSNVSMTNVYVCTTGFRIGSSTSVKLYGCFAGDCATGYDISGVYGTLINCACDGATECCYYFSQAANNIVCISLGAERFFKKLLSFYYSNHVSIYGMLFQPPTNNTEADGIIYIYNGRQTFLKDVNDRLLSNNYISNYVYQYGGVDTRIVCCNFAEKITKQNYINGLQNDITIELPAMGDNSNLYGHSVYNITGADFVNVIVPKLYSFDFKGVVDIKITDLNGNLNYNTQRTLRGINKMERLVITTANSQNNVFDTGEMWTAINECNTVIEFKDLVILPYSLPSTSRPYVSVENAKVIFTNCDFSQVNREGKQSSNMVRLTNCATVIFNNCTLPSDTTKLYTADASCTVIGV